MEILAPAGGKEQLIAAVRAGADAVYLGTDSFNARRNAKNFGPEELKEAVSYCHGRGVKVHVTVNTLVTDRELRDLYDTIRVIADSGADAVILQDLAALSMFKKYLPEIARHASTQMTIHNLEGLRAAEDLGFSRAVLARELSLEEIRYLADNTKMELECFVHGALCMSVSGQCGLSSMFGGRSGNRGLCAQPCRLDFRAGDRSYALSLKDMSYIQRIKELEAAGVCSVKIEGRMKRPEYVAAATEACVKALRGEAPDMERLEKVFSRSGFTDGYLTGRRNISMFGRRTEEDEAESAQILSKVTELYRRELSRIPVDMELSVQKDEPARITVSDGVNTLTVLGDIPEKVINKELDAYQSLSKTGGTPFVLGNLKLDVDKAYTVKLNNLRQEALAQLLALRETVKPYDITGEFEPVISEERQTKPVLRLRFNNTGQLFSAGEAEYIYLPIEEIDRELIMEYGDKLIGELPRLVFPLSEPKLTERLLKLKEEGLSRLCAGNIGLIRLAKRLGFIVHGGFDLNIINTKALETYEDYGLEDAALSYEINIKDAVRLGGGIKRGLIGYGYLPLMLYRNCPVRTAKGCGACRGIGRLTDRQQKSFPVLCHNREYSSLLNSLPLYIGDKEVRGLDFLTLYFTTEDRERCRQVYEKYLSGEALNEERTNGLYYRNLL
ncbi:MAG: U32 family peptidase [Papillibacter sp.]|nr:U32 family peptidase [Papillibacter sp.]